MPPIWARIISGSVLGQEVRKASRRMIKAKGSVNAAVLTKRGFPVEPAKLLPPYWDLSIFLHPHPAGRYNCNNQQYCDSRLELVTKRENFVFGPPPLYEPKPRQKEIKWSIFREPTSATRTFLDRY
jgi:hypothetical protein